MFQFVESKVRLDGPLRKKSLSPDSDKVMFTELTGWTVNLTLNEVELPSATTRSKTVGRIACTLDVLKFDT